MLAIRCPAAHLGRLDTSNPITRLNAALQGADPRLRLFALPALAFLALAACDGGGERRRLSAGGPSGVLRARSDLSYVVVTHGSSADPFWSVVANGAAAAARDLGVRVSYQAPNTFDMVAMSQLIDAAVASRPDGLVVSVPDADALGPAIRAAVATGMPVITINSGEDTSPALGALAHVGQSEAEVGFQAGQRLTGGGARRVLCVNHEIGNVGLDRRCEGLRRALAAAGGSASILTVDLADPEDTRQRVAGALAADPLLDGMLTLGTTGAGPALAALRGSERASAVRLGTFDLSPPVLEAVRAGDLQFAIDQQQYLQGYLPIVLLTLYLETGTIPGGGRPLPTGPVFVTAATAERAVELARRGLR